MNLDRSNSSLETLKSASCSDVILNTVNRYTNTSQNDIIGHQHTYFKQLQLFPECLSPPTWLFGVFQLPNESSYDQCLSPEFCTCASSGSLLVGITCVRRRVLIILLPGGGSEACRGGYRVWGGGVTEALVPPAGGRRGGHGGGCHRNRVLRG